MMWKALEGVCRALVMSTSAEARFAFCNRPKTYLIAKVIAPSQPFFTIVFHKVVGMSLHRAAILEHNFFKASYATDPKVFLLARLAATSSTVLASISARFFLDIW